MADKVTPFVVNDRRKFSTEGELRPESERAQREEEAPKAPEPTAAAPTPEPAKNDEPVSEQEMPRLTEEQTMQVKAAYDATADRLNTAMRAANPGAEHPPAMSFDGLVQSIYMTSIMQLGGGTPEGEQARVDIIGAKQSIDMLGLLQEKTKGNLTETEIRLLDNALFELRMAFLEITQAIARQAAQMENQDPLPPPPGGPRIVR